MVYRGLKPLFTGVLTLSVVVASALPASAARRQTTLNQESGSCPALDQLLDEAEARNSAPAPHQAPHQAAKQDEFSPGVMAAFSECLVRGAVNDETTKGELRVALQSLSQRGLAAVHEIAPVVALINETGGASQASQQPSAAAASIFAANSMIQIAEASRLLDTRMGRLRAADARMAVAQFASEISRRGVRDSADSADFIAHGQGIRILTTEIAGRVDEVAQLAAVTSRRDMAASLTTRLRTFSRRSGDASALNVPTLHAPTLHAAAILDLQKLFEEANSQANTLEYSGINGQVERDAARNWSTAFDGRLMAVLKTVSPEAQSPAEAVEVWHAALRRANPEVIEAGPGSSATLDAKVLIELAPDQMRSEVYETAEAIRRALPEVRKSVEQSSGMIDRSMLGFTDDALAAIRQVELILEGVALRVRRSTNPDEILQVWQHRDMFKNIAVWTLEASASKSKTATRLAAVFSGAVSRMWQPDVMFLRMDDLHQLHGIIEDQNSENWVRAFVNRQMAVVYAQSALLLGEAIAVPFSGGASGAAMPATLHAIVVGLQVAGKATLIVTSSLNIADRYVQDGVKGLVNPASGLDALTIIMMLPRPIPGPVDAQSWFGRALQSGRNSAAGWMHEAGRFAVVGHTAFGAYQIAYADHIAATLRLQGYQTSAAEVRRQAFGHFAQAFLLGMVEWGEYQRGQALGGDHHSQVIAATNPFKIFAKRLRNMVFPHKAAIDAYNSLAPVIGAPLAGAVAVLPAAAYIAYDYVIASEAMMYFYAGTDFGYFAHNRNQQEYPDLAAGESAVTFVGFDEADMLHAGAHAIDAHRLEMEKYGNRYFIYDYHSREEFLTKLASHASQHGPVKYMRIMTHGLPGKLYTADVQVSAGDGEDTAQRDGWIDAPWLRKNRDRIRGIAANGMAPGARAVLFACLVGANMDTAAPGLAEDSGDDFLRAFGETLLYQGGLIDASVRFLVGLDTVYGSMLNWAARDEVIRNGALQHQPVLPLNLFREGKSGLLEADEKLRAQMSAAVIAAATGDGLVVAPSDNDAAGWSQSTEMLQYAVARMWRMMTQLHKLGIRYGIQLEGPWWSTPRYKHAYVEPVSNPSSPSGAGVNVRIVRF